MKRNSFFLLTCFSFCSFCALDAQEPVLHPSVITVNYFSDSAISHCMVSTDQVYEAGLDTLPEIIFWRKIMNLSPDTGIVSLASNRCIYCYMSSAKWDLLGDDGQEKFRDSLRIVNFLDDSASVLFTKGKNNFYDPVAVIPEIDRAIPIFVQEGVDPFYAQAILLIESPGKSMKSYAGANGPFQLMRSVAVQMGLKVNKKVDERNDFDKSAWAAAKLLKTICIPMTNQMLDKRGITYDPNDLWYRLLVLHVYHAGSGNVDKALDVIDPCEGNIELIEQLWHTQAGAFGRSSQAYSQLVVSAFIELDLANGKCDPREKNCSN
ncbi:MAG: transglycosylase SLT domain-containing protein [Bacteroidetes bacterium]|nr:transglycosylase SLT domain-containing protein [Bacteroidota bacterium]